VFTRKPVISKTLLKRVAVNFFTDGTTFIGHLADFDNSTYVFEQCETVPAAGETANAIKGRVYVDRINCWLQELPT
jgi:hypothetical protein